MNEHKKCRFCRADAVQAFTVLKLFNGAMVPGTVDPSETWLACSNHADRGHSMAYIERRRRETEWGGEHQVYTFIVDAEKFLESGQQGSCKRGET